MPHFIVQRAKDNPKPGISRVAGGRQHFPDDLLDAFFMRELLRSREDAGSQRDLDAFGS